MPTFLAPADPVPAAAVRQEELVLSVMTGPKGRAGGCVSPNSNTPIYIGHTMGTKHLGSK